MVLTNLTASDCVNVDSGEMWRGSPKNGLTGAPSRSGDDVDRSAGRAGVDERVSWDGRKKDGVRKITIRKKMVKSVSVLRGFEPRPERGRAPRAHSVTIYL